MASKDTSTERLWLTEPRRRTSLSEVVEVRGNTFRLDRTLYHPKMRTYHHPQRRDRGVLWIEGGEKRKLATVREQGGDVWHRLRGTVPSVGDELQCHLDTSHRERVERAHTAMHLLLRSMWSHDGPALVEDPEVKGGGTFRMELEQAYVDGNEVKRWLDRANQWVREDHDVTYDHVPRDAAEARHSGVHEQLIHGAPSFPGPETTLRVVHVGSACTYPCDGTHVERTSEVGRIVMQHARPTNRGTFLTVGKVQDP